MTGLCILGSTGSIGRSTLDVVSRHRDRYDVVALSANRDVDKLEQQCLDFAPRVAVMADKSCALVLQDRLRSAGSDIQVLGGSDALDEIAVLPQVDFVMAAIVGAAGLPSSLAAARAGKRVLLANKEALVMSGQLFMQAVAEHGAELVPIDSEHNAVFQCLPAGASMSTPAVGVRSVILTASGGPFLTRSLETFDAITPAEAVAHPNWSMGRKISVDSATMMNKGLEVIEACLLFAARPDQVEVIIHPQSIIHSLVTYADGSVLAQLGNPDMRTPIAHALAWPARMESGVLPLDLLAIGSLEFSAPEMRRFPCLQLAYDAIRAGGSAPAILNAANEIAVDAFLEGRIPFTRIPQVVEAALAAIPADTVASIDETLAVDQRTRLFAGEFIHQKHRQLAT